MDGMKHTKLWDNVGKALFDIAKIRFGSVVVGTLLRGEINTVILFLYGLITSVLLFLAGAVVFILNEE